MSLNNARHVVLGSGLPPIAQKTLRFKFHDSFNPVTDLTSVPLGSWTQVASNVFDYTYTGTDWTYNSGNDGLFNSMTQTGVNYPMGQHPFDILDGDLTGVTNVSKLFNSAKQVKRCTIRNTGSITNFSSMFYHGQMALEYVAPLDITSATSLVNFCISQASTGFSLVFTRDSSLPATPCDAHNMLSGNSGHDTNVTSVSFPDSFKVSDGRRMFYGSHITYVPSNFDFSGVSDVSGICSSCYYLESGALALYNKLSSLVPLPVYDNNCFLDCGRDAPADAPIHTEMQQIPASWGGNGA